MNLAKETLLKLNHDEILTIAEFTMTQQLLMMRRIPQLLMSLSPDEQYDTEVKKYASLLLSLSDQSYTLPSIMSSRDIEGITTEITSMADFLLDVNEDEDLTRELNASDTISYFLQNGLIAAG